MGLRRFGKMALRTSATGFQGQAFRLLGSGNGGYHMMHAKWRITSLSLAAVLGFALTASAAVTFTGVGDLGGGVSSAAGVSADGTLVVGSSTDGNADTQAYIWDGAIHALGFPGDVNYSAAVAVDIAPDTSVKVAVTGKMDYTPYPAETQAFLWSGTGAGVGAYDPAILLYPDGNSTNAMDIMVDTTGEVYMCGYGKRADWVNAYYYHGWRWRSMPSFLELGTSSNYPVYANSISRFGQIAGQMQYGGTSPGGGARHAVWWQSSVFTLIPTLKGPATTSNESIAKAISLDGTAVTGWSDPTSGARQAFWWQRGGTTATAIPYLAGDNWNEGLAMNADGQVIGGFSTLSTGGAKRAFIWDATNGSREVRQMLIDAGIDMTGWELEEVTGISEDGSVICGNGKLSGVAKGWVASGLPAVSPLPPKIAEVTPDPGTTGAGAEYVRQLTQVQGTLLATTWTVEAGPPGATVSSSGLVSGWTPGTSDIGTTFTFTIRATSSAGFDDETWQVTVINTGPTVNPPLYPNPSTPVSVVVSGIDGASNSITRVTLYRNRYDSGSGTWVETELAYADASSTPALATNATTYTFTLAANELLLDDVIKATQHRGTVESDRGVYWRTVIAPLPSPQTYPVTTWGFSDDFELPYIKPQWQRPYTLTLSSAQSIGMQSVRESPTGGQWGMDAAPNLLSADRSCMLYEFWMYDEGAGLGGYARHLGGVAQMSGNGFAQGAESFVFEIGSFPNVTLPAAGPSDPTKYQWRFRRTYGGTEEQIGNMDAEDSGGPAPGRSAGWHKFSIKHSGQKIFWYVDGVMGHRRVSTAGKWNSLYIGSPAGNTGTVNTGNGVVTLDGYAAYYDNVLLKQYLNRTPTMSAPQTVSVVPGAPITPIVVTATDPDAAAGIGPDYAFVNAFSFNVSGLNWTASTLQLTGAGKFRYYTWQPGDQINITAGATLGWVGVVAKVDDSTITLASSISASDVTTATIAGTIGLPPNPTTWVPTLSYQTGTPSGTVTITGTPPSAAVGETYNFLFYGRDDLNNLDVEGVYWNRTRVTITVIPPCNTYPQDQDNDNDVDLVDFGTFQSCFNGPNRAYKGPPPSAEICRCMDDDKDDDVDLVDFGKFQNCFNGPNRAPKAGCI